MTDLPLCQDPELYQYLSFVFALISILLIFSIAIILRMIVVLRQVVHQPTEAPNERTVRF
jgi:hypothetical protein